MTTCDICGVALGGSARKEHTLAVIRDSLLVHGAHYCVEHLEQLETAYAEARDAVAAASLRSRLLGCWPQEETISRGELDVALGGGGA